MIDFYSDKDDSKATKNSCLYRETFSQNPYKNDSHVTTKHTTVSGNNLAQESLSKVSEALSNLMNTKKD